MRNAYWVKGFFYKNIDIVALGCSVENQGFKWYSTLLSSFLWYSSKESSGTGDERPDLSDDLGEGLKYMLSRLFCSDSL